MEGIMKTYKTSEAFKMLEENQKLVFKSGVERIFCSKEGYFHFVVEGASEAYPAGRFNGNIYIMREWELVEEPVTWQEAIQAWANGSAIRVEWNNGIFEEKFRQTCYFKLGLTGENDMLKNGIPCTAFQQGKWYIEG
jgi:hypothetical protein